MLMEMDGFISLTGMSAVYAEKGTIGSYFSGQGQRSSLFSF
jgi:hypothetical protein